MLTIGLCGGSGSGKGEVCKIFGKYGIPSIDTDALYRELTAEDTDCMKELVLEFGDNIRLPDGSLDRKLLASLVFSSDGKEKKKKLEEITHRHILLRVREMLKEYATGDARPPAVIVDAPLLYESEFDKECNFVIAVICDEETRVKRIIKRDNIDEQKARARIASQIPDGELIKMADFCIINNGEGNLEQKVIPALQNILRRR